MGIIKRRSFLQTIATSVYACLGVLSGKKATDWLRTEEEVQAARKKKASDICNEALERIGYKSENKVIPEAPLKIFNGQVFEAPWPICHTIVVQYFGRGDQWLLMSDPYKSSRCNGTAMMVCYYERKNDSYNPFYTQAELQEKLKDWKLIEDKRLSLI